MLSTEETGGSDRIPKLEPIPVLSTAPEVTAAAAAALPTTQHIPPSCLQHSRTHPKHLHSNSTSHVWAFGAIAELIDNALDSGASKISIEHIKLAQTQQSKEQSALLFIDNGHGLDHEGLIDMCSFGVCHKKGSDIGEYGNGFKSGAMRTGKTCVVLTKQANTGMLYGVLLSRIYLDHIGASEILLPMVSWSQHSAGYQQQAEPGSEHNLGCLLQYSGLDSEDSLLSLVQEKLGASSSGTMILVTELTDIWDICEPGDLVLQDAEVPRDNAVTAELSSQWKRSLKAYCKILYLEPALEIFIRGVAATHLSIVDELKKVQHFNKVANANQLLFGINLVSVKPEVRNGVQKSELRDGLSVDVLWRADKKYYHAVIQEFKSTSKGVFCKVQYTKELSYENNVALSRIMHVDLVSAQQETIELSDLSGTCFYNRKVNEDGARGAARLILPFHRLGTGLEESDIFQGVVGVVETNNLNVTHNKQDYLDKNNEEFRNIRKALASKMERFCVENDSRDVLDELGVTSSTIAIRQCNQDVENIRKRGEALRQVDATTVVDGGKVDDHWLCCSSCERWRIVTLEALAIYGVPEKQWFCGMRPGTNCSQECDTIRFAKEIEAAAEAEQEAADGVAPPPSKRLKSTLKNGSKLKGAAKRSEAQVWRAKAKTLMAQEEKRMHDEQEKAKQVASKSRSERASGRIEQSIEQQCSKVPKGDAQSKRQAREAQQLALGREESDSTDEEGFDEQIISPKYWPHDVLFTPMLMWKGAEEVQRLINRPMIMKGVDLKPVGANHPAFDPSGKAQHGLFASRTWQKGSVLGQYTGMVRQCAKGSHRSSYELDYDRSNELIIDAQFHGNETRFINSYHNVCTRPNVEFKLRPRPKHVPYPIVEVVVLSKVSTGVEFVADYETSLHADGIEVFTAGAAPLGEGALKSSKLEPTD